MKKIFIVLLVVGVLVAVGFGFKKCVKREVVEVEKQKNISKEVLEEVTSKLEQDLTSLNEKASQIDNDSQDPGELNTEEDTASFQKEDETEKELTTQTSSIQTDATELSVEEDVLKEIEEKLDQMTDNYDQTIDDLEQAKRSLDDLNSKLDLVSQNGMLVSDDGNLVLDKAKQLSERAGESINQVQTNSEKYDQILTAAKAVYDARWNLLQAKKSLDQEKIDQSTREFILILKDNYSKLNKDFADKYLEKLPAYIKQSVEYKNIFDKEN